MDDEHSAANQLGGLALGNVLKEIGIDEEYQDGIQQRLGISSNTNLKPDQIYKDTFHDDEDDHDHDLFGPEGQKSSARDWETEVDDEMRNELDLERKKDTEERAALERYYRQGMAQLERPKTTLRGEDDDFDDHQGHDNDVRPMQEDDYDDEEDDVPLAAGSAAVATSDLTTVRIKTEQEDHDGLSLFDDQPSIPLPPLPTSPNQGVVRDRDGMMMMMMTPPPPSVDPRYELDLKEVKQLFPDFEPGKILNFTEMFATRPAKKPRTIGKPAHFKLHPEDQLPRPRSTREIMLSHPERRKARGKPFVVQLTEELLRASGPQDGMERDEFDLLPGLGHVGKHARGAFRLDMVELEDWEDQVEWGGDRVTDGSGSGVDVPSSQQPPTKALEISASLVDKPFNHDLSGGDWLKSIIWDRSCPFRDFSHLVLDMNDPQMMLEEDNGPVVKQNSLLRSDLKSNNHALGHRHLAASAKGGVELDPFNLSNDKFYEQTREHRHRVRQTLGKLVVQHAWPATKLQLPFYKTKLSKVEARSFHRPAMQFPTNMPLTFSKTRSSKKRKDGAKRGAKDPNEVLRTTRDLTLKDTGPFVLYEYSEEYPPLLSNLGMGSLLVNYYRKKDAKDDTIPKADIGEPYVLDVSDESPFMKFGSIDEGQTQPTLYNNLVRAPLFRHKAAHTDFLLVRSTTKDEIRYYLREIKNLFTVGQTYPVVPIPGPHARLVTNNIKYRLQMIAFKLVQKSYRQRIKIYRLMRYFPDQNELQMRQRLKEFMEYNRKAGDINQGYWKLKPHIVVPEEQELLKLLPPENVCLAEAMQVGQRHLLDAGYTKTAEGADEDGDESKMDIEQLLAPWITSKNFINATQGKAMLKLHGEGDPTGRGEAFSFIRVSMKEIFLRAGEDAEERMALAEMEAKSKSGHKYSVAEQQAVYRSEIERIWKAQHNALSNPVPPVLTEADEHRQQPVYGQAAPPPPPSGHGHHFHLSRAESLRRQRSPSAMSNASAQDTQHTPSGGGGGGSQAGENSGKVLRIRRLVNGKWQKEIVKDPAVINAYVRQRQKIEDEMLATEDLVPTGDDAVDAARMKRLQEELAQRKKNQERRMQRKNAKAAAEGLPIPGGYKKLLNKTDTKRKCGRCGAVGHMSTNTSCPMYPSQANGNMVGTPGGSGGVGGVGLEGGGGGGGGGVGGVGGLGTPGTRTPLGSASFLGMGPGGIGMGVVGPPGLGAMGMGVGINSPIPPSPSPLSAGVGGAFSSSSNNHQGEGSLQAGGLSAGLEGSSSLEMALNGIGGGGESGGKSGPPPASGGGGFKLKLKKLSKPTNASSP
ncbi:hypothetical protein IE53DRAFT_159988 [Violaceomyces palustris]|uniref:Uncharacterized protein n=1 Tax=Violaceomyces palustris TaxID=1673888 RepID=A0ACD0NTQ5_9BASI|nr:hypothetical protein IE53DRAFT_159988 [Violaceomyces palustris]